MILNPPPINPPAPEAEAIDEILDESGVFDTSIASSNNVDANEVLKKEFKKCGADLEFVAEQIKNIACRGESETARISATKFIAEILEVKTQLEKTPTPVGVTINIVGSENKSIINLVMPKG